MRIQLCPVAENARRAAGVIEDEQRLVGPVVQAAYRVPPRRVQHVTSRRLSQVGKPTAPVRVLPGTYLVAYGTLAKASRSG